MDIDPRVLLELDREDLILSGRTATGKFIKLAVVGCGAIGRRLEVLSLNVFIGLNMVLGFGKEYRRHKPPFPSKSCVGIKRVEDEEEEIEEVM